MERSFACANKGALPPIEAERIVVMSYQILSVVDGPGAMDLAVAVGHRIAFFVGLTVKKEDKKLPVEISVESIRSLNRENRIFLFEGKASPTQHFWEAFETRDDRVSGVINCHKRQGWICVGNSIDSDLIDHLVECFLLNHGIIGKEIATFIDQALKIFHKPRQDPYMQRLAIQLWVESHPVEAVVAWQRILAKQGK